MTDALGETSACGLDTRQIRNQPSVGLCEHTCEYQCKLGLSVPSTDRLSCTTAETASFCG